MANIELLDKIVDLAKQNLARDGYLFPVGFVFKGDELIQIIPMTNTPPSGKDQNGYNAYILGAVARKMGGDTVVFVWDAAFRTYPKDIDIQNMDEFERPLLYPKSMRTECIIAQLIPTSDTEKSLCKIIPYKGGDGEPIEWLTVDVPGEFSSRFDELVHKGYEVVVPSPKE